MTHKCLHAMVRVRVWNSACVRVLERVREIECGSERERERGMELEERGLLAKRENHQIKLLSEEGKQVEAKTCSNIEQVREVVVRPRKIEREREREREGEREREQVSKRKREVEQLSNINPLFSQQVVELQRTRAKVKTVSYSVKKQLSIFSSLGFRQLELRASTWFLTRRRQPEQLRQWSEIGDSATWQKQTGGNFFAAK